MNLFLRISVLFAVLGSVAATAAEMQRLATRSTLAPLLHRPARWSISISGGKIMKTAGLCHFWGWVTILFSTISPCEAVPFAFFGDKPLGMGVVHGYKFNDLNGNGQDNTEPRLAGIEVLLAGIDDPSISEETVTGPDGSFVFTDLPNGSFEICEVATPPWVPTTPECVEVELIGKAPDVPVNFGNHRPTSTEGCVRTQGFWGSSPAGQALVPILVPGTLFLGSVAYSAAQLDQILDQPAAGNALLNLAHQLIAARLNILAGADASPIAATLIAADAAIGGLVSPPVGAGSVNPGSPLGQTMVNLAGILDDYNNGELGVEHCP